MARIRSVKPELCDSELVASWPIDVRYFWVLLWTYLDDYGRGLDMPKRIAGALFPHDKYDGSDIDQWLELMGVDLRSREGHGPVCRYTVDDKRYLHAVHWDEHQKVNHPTPSRIPPCPTHENVGTPPESLQNDAGEAAETVKGSNRVGSKEVGSRKEEVGTGEKDTARDTRAGPTRGTRMPDPFPVNEPMLAWAHEHAPTVDPRRETAVFADHWRAQPGQRGIKTDWEATWRNWMRRAATYATPARASPGNHAHNGLIINDRTADDLARIQRMAALDATRAATVRPAIEGGTG